MADPLDTLTDGSSIAVLPVSNFMPPGGEGFEFAGSVTLPAIGASAVVLSFPVPDGRNGMVKRIANVLVGGGFNDFSGALIWQILQDASGTPPIVVPNFDNIQGSLGLINQPSAIDGFRIKEGQLVQLIIKNVSLAVAGQIVAGRLGGYFYPIELDPDGIGF